MSNYKKSRPFAKDNSKYESSDKHNTLSDRYQKSYELLVPISNKKTENKIEKEERNTIDPPNNESNETNIESEKEEVSEDANVLGAKLLKAEIMGDEDLVKDLKARLEAAQKIADAIKKEQKQNEQNEDIYQELNPYKKSSSHHKKHKKDKKHHRHDRDIKNEVNKFMKKDQEFDDGNSSNKQQRTGENTSSKKQEANTEKVANNCRHCFDNVKKHLVVSIGKFSYLCLPATQSITEGNCLIIPINHCSSSVTCDEEVWEEIKQFRRALVNMFEKKRIDCIFFEQYSVNKKYAHMIIECVPLDMSVSNMAPIYFKKAIIESESEWAQNKSIINLKDKKVRDTIPRNMPYFTVDFGLDNGYAHVIENDDAFPDYFAKEIIGGILDLDPLSWRNTKDDLFSVQSQKVIKFLQWWKSYDFNNNK